MRRVSRAPRPLPPSLRAAPAPTLQQVVLPYPDWWLQSVGYDRFPQPPALVMAPGQVTLPPYRPPLLVPVAPPLAVPAADRRNDSADSATGGQAAIPAEPTPPAAREPPTLLRTARERAQPWAAPFALGAAAGALVATIAISGVAGGARALRLRADGRVRATACRVPLVAADGGDERAL